MQNRHFTAHARPRWSRLLIAVVTAFSLIAASGLVTAGAQAQGPAQFVFQGSGWGHGVGMSQNGARNAADSGMDHVGILNFYYPNTTLAQYPTLDAIRVHIGDAPRVELTSAGSMTFERGGVAINAIPSGTMTVSAHDGGLQIGDAWTTGSASDPLFVSFPQPVKISNNGHRYLWGKLQITNKNGKVRVVEVLPLEDYVAGIAEMPAAWPLEALKAQAITARTYAHEVTLHRRNSPEWAQEYDISGTTVDQNYIGYDAQDSAWDQKWLAAVQATAGVELIDGNGPVRAYYSATNGGYTETAAYVFNNNVAHTVAGPDPYDAGGHDWTQWTRTYSQESISRWLGAKSDTAVGTVTSINVGGGAGASARIDKAIVEIVGTQGTKQVTGKRLMLVINAGVFGEGGGLSTHLPGTFTTVGNGAGAGWPIPSGAPVPITTTPDPVVEVATPNEDFTPPPGWKPEAGTGVAPRAGGIATTDEAAPVEGEATAGEQQTLGTLDLDGTYTPPDGWEPEAGAGVAPGAENTTAPPLNATTGGAAYTPPEGWVPEAGTGVAPKPIVAIEPTGTQAPADANPADTNAADTETVGGTGGAYAPPADWKPEPGSGVAPSAQAARESYTPPADWKPEPGTGVAPTAARSTSNDEFVGGTGGGDAVASGVLLVTRTADTTELSDATFQVIAPTADLAAEARQRLQTLQTRAALGLFADVDIDGYVASVAPRPVHGVCTATVHGVTCVPLEAFQD